MVYVRIVSRIFSGSKGSAYGTVVLVRPEIFYSWTISTMFAALGLSTVSRSPIHMYEELNRGTDTAFNA